MRLAYQDFVVREAVESDAILLSAWWNDGSIMAHAGFPLGTGQTPAVIAQSLRSDSDDSRRRLIIEAGSIPIGEMNYTNLGDNTAEIGIKICNASRRNKGIGKIVLSMLITALFDGLGYRKIVLDTDLDNTHAQHVYERLGFRRLRLQKNGWTDQLGTPRSAVDYELTPKAFISFLS